MRAVWNGSESVQVLEVGRLSSRVAYRRAADGDRVRLWVRNLELSPEPCGACLGKGCKACEGRGHSPRKSQVVLRLSNTITSAWNQLLGRRERDPRHIIDAERCEQEHIEAGRCPECLLELHEGDCP